MAHSKKEAISVSFHYLARVREESQSRSQIVKFTPDEFDGLFSSLKSKPTLNLEDERDADRLRYRQEVPIENVERVTSQIIFGLFKSSYWGHAYENSARGSIPASSISLRPFYFLLYLSSSGRIYVGCQYLGHFGGYTGLRSTVSNLLSNSDTIISSSFRADSLDIEKTSAKEVRVTFSNRSSSIADPNVFSRGGMLAFKKASKDDGFEKQVAEKILPHFGRPSGQIKKNVAELINQNRLIDIKDNDIDDCTIIASVDGKKKVIYLLENGSFASRFPLNVPTTLDGHPKYSETKAAMIKILREEIISRAEDA